MSPGWTRAARPKAHLENGREWAEGEARGGPSLAECVVSQAEPSRVANGRHHSEGGAECQAAEESTWHYKVPLLLLVLLAVFFGVVAMLYVNMRMPLLPTLRSVPALVSRALASLSLPVPFFTPHTAQWTPPNALPQPALPPAAPPLPPAAPPLPRRHTSSQHTENKFPVCSSTLKNNCLTVQAMAQVQPILGQLEEVVLPALHHQAGLYQCGDTTARHLSVAALQDLLHHHTVSSRSSGVGVDVVESLGRLVEWNPHWGLEAVRGETDGVLLGLALSTQPTHILCHITTAIYSFFYLIMGLVTDTTMNITTPQPSQPLSEHLITPSIRLQVYELVEQILEVLGGLGGASGKDFVAVNHVRDSLISPRDRRTKQALWDRAVLFINCNESRVRREIQAVGGEDCEVWRWASGLPHHPHNSSGVDGGDGVGRPPPKVWQGPAFNTLSPHNVPNVSPTSCLKIRNMFDCDVEFGDSWPARIQDSILEKCEGISIVHVAVDRGSREGCVYLKCASLSDSGRAFRALHGWWYDGNLVTVKFLRDERYYQRFPSARHATRRLRPSNNKRLSLQVPAAAHHCQLCGGDGHCRYIQECQTVPASTLPCLPFRFAAF
ncbi:Inner nuclear membrane protein Man1 [Portunus trituberculatus]|uniref:Inner nuclear membrane protein Man1 n=1 Tax=Portunus trituberculatus TaxID=210409 RepID=A0A5B7CM52_PORTR|nr:Inner nuclear membrane protein Man1 [Portunus trituberculatus]